MSFETNSPNMLLPIPGVGLTAGPTYATDVNNCLTLIDQHDHSPGAGVAIGTSGINIQSSFSINSNDLTFVRTVRMNSQSAVLVGADDLDCIYVVGDDLYYNDGLGNNIRITQSGAVAGTPGSIANLVPPASASYASNTFTFQSAATVAASIDGRNFILRNATANSKGLTLSPPGAMGADISMVLPTLPLTTSFVTISPAGVMGSGTSLTAGITGSMIAASTITESNITPLTLTGASIADNSLNAGNKIEAGSVDTSSMAANINLPGDHAKVGSRIIVSSMGAPSGGKQLLIVRGQVSASGAATVGEGFTCSRLANPGYYRITTNLSFGGDGGICVVTPVAASGTTNLIIPSVSSPSSANFDVFLKDVNGVTSNSVFNFIIIGERA